MDQWVMFQIAGSKKKNILNILLVIGKTWLNLSHSISNQQKYRKMVAPLPYSTKYKRRREHLNIQRGALSSLEKKATCDFGPVTVKSCKRALFFIYIWIISWDATNKSLL